MKMKKKIEARVPICEVCSKEIPIEDWEQCEDCLDKSTKSLSKSQEIITRNATIDDVDKFDLVFEKRNNYPYLQMKAIRHFREELIEELKKGSD